MNQEPNTFESTRNTSQDEILKSDPPVSGLETQDIDKTISAPDVDIADHLDFFNDAALAARNHVRVDIDSSDAQDIAVSHPSSPEAKKPGLSKRDRVLAGGALITLAAAGTTALTLGPIADVIDEHFEHQSEQNKQWSDEAEEAQRQLDNGTIVIDLPPENK